jgi:DNA repair protein RadC
LVHPREVFTEAVRQRATAIVVAHNHPSGNLEPSMEDKDVTRRLRQAGDLLGIRILDHLIFGEEGFLSMLEGNLF